MTNRHKTIFGLSERKKAEFKKYCERTSDKQYVIGLETANFPTDISRLILSYVTSDCTVLVQSLSGVKRHLEFLNTDKVRPPRPHVIAIYVRPNKSMIFHWNTNFGTLQYICGRIKGNVSYPLVRSEMTLHSTTDSLIRDKQDWLIKRLRLISRQNNGDKSIPK